MADFDDLEEKGLTRLLHLGFQKARRPLDELLDERPDQEAWFRSLIEESPVARLGPPEDKLARGQATLVELRSVYKESKLLLRKAKTKEDRQTALLGYLLAIAAGLAHHRTLITTRAREEIDPLLLDLTGAAPKPWAELLTAALRTCSSP